MNKFKGFTLIEILIALTVFAILATITSSILFYAFNARTRVNTQAERLNTLQLAVSIMQQDITQIIERPIRGDEMSLSPVLVGQTEYMEFTRGGIVNPNSVGKSSTLKRIGLLCKNGKLLRRTWLSLDSTTRKVFHDKVLLDGLTQCHFNYLNQNLNVLAEWREQSTNQSQHAEKVPKAIQIKFTLKEWGEMSLLFIIPGGLYAAT